MPAAHSFIPINVYHRIPTSQTPLPFHLIVFLPFQVIHSPSFIIPIPSWLAPHFPCARDHHAFPPGLNSLLGLYHVQSCYYLFPFCLHPLWLSVLTWPLPRTYSFHTSPIPITPYNSSSVHFILFLSIRDPTYSHCYLIIHHHHLHISVSLITFSYPFSLSKPSHTH